MMTKHSMYLLVTAILVLSLEAQATYLSVENGSFEQPGTVKIIGWNGEGVAETPAVDIPGWASDTEATDSGVETGWGATDGEWTAFLKGGDSSIWQSMDYVLAAGDVLEVSLNAVDNWNATTLSVTLYYVDDGARIPLSTSAFEVGDTMQNFTLLFSTTDYPDSIGKQLGVEIDNVTEDPESWIGLDEVLVSVSGASYPSPSDGSCQIEVTTLLTWQPGIGADSYNVYFGTSYDNVHDGVGDSFKENTNAPEYSVTGLNFGTYFWRIDKITASQVTTGDVWSFSVGLFKDANLKAAVIQSLKANPPFDTDNPTPSDMENLNFLNAADCGIIDLTGLEFAKNLQVLFLEKNHISNIDALAGLNQLQVLMIWENQISDISDLRNLTDLVALDLSDNSIDDISAISELTKLEGLVLNGCPIGDDGLRFLADLSELKALHLISTQLSDITDLSVLKGLQELFLVGNQISDIAAINGMSKLQILYLDDNLINNIDALLGLQSLTELGLAGALIDDISPLASLESLKMLNLSSNQRITDFSPLKYLKNLRWLYINNSDFSDISALENLTLLEALEIRHNNISDISYLSNLMGLSELDLQRNRITDLSPIVGMDLRVLKFNHNQVQDLSPIEDMLALEVIYAQSNRIYDLAPLLDITTLRTLWLQDNPLSPDSFCAFIPAIVGFNRNLIDFQYDENQCSCEPTPSGQNVDVTPIDTATGSAPVTITFGDITESGFTSLTTSQSAPASLTGFQLGDSPTFYDISTSASFTGLIEVCIIYSGVSVPEPVEDLRLLHYEDGQWVDCTISLETANHIICGAVTSLSPFVIAHDVAPPTINSIFASPSTVSPVNHKMVEVTITVDVQDNSGLPPVCTIIDITSNEPINGPGNGNTTPDWEITGDLTMDLRAERSGNLEDRIYTITVECVDASGNATTGTVIVTVPHDNGGKKK